MFEDIAKNKLARIIAREGDNNGERLTPEYLQMLVEELKTQNIIGCYCELQGVKL